MARIRTIKPEFFTSEDIVSLTPLARLFYVSLWCEADREGRLPWRPGTLKMRYLPADACDIETLSGELLDASLIVLYESDGKKFAEIPSFKNHQVINNREAESTIPPRVKVACTRVEAEGRKEGKGKERKGKEGYTAPEGVSEQVWQDFVKSRKTLRAEITQSAIDGIQREADKAGWLIEDALKECCLRGWRGFKAEWVANKSNSSPTVVNKQEALEARNREVVARMLAKENSDDEQ